MRLLSVIYILDKMPIFFVFWALFESLVEFILNDFENNLGRLLVF